MRVIYSYINFNDIDSIGTDYLFPGILSAYKSIELYGNATLYTTKENIDKLKKFDLPFTNYIQLEKPNTPQFATVISKLFTYCKQKEPYIHLDLDVILNSKYNLETNESTPVKFSHVEAPNHISFGHIHGLYNGYFQPGYVLGEKYGFSAFEDLRLNEIPNMGIISCYDPEVFTLATEKVLKIYNENINYFSKENLMGISFLEQGLIHMYLRQLSKPYAESIHHGTNLAYEIDNLLFVYKKDTHIEVPEPISTTVLNFTDEKDLINNFNLDKYKSYHLLGGSKACSLSQSLIIHKLLNYISVNKLVEIENTLDVKNRNFLNQYFNYIK